MQLFRTNYHVLVFRWTFQPKVAKSGSIHSWFGQNLHFFEQTTMSWHFHELFSKKVQKVPHFVKKEGEMINMDKTMQLFEQTTMSLHFDELFRKKLQKVHFVKKHEKPSIWNYATFSNKLPRGRVRVRINPNPNYHVLTFRWTFQRKVAKTSFREKAQKFVDLAKTMQLLRTNYHVLVFRWTFEQKVAKSCSIREKPRKIIDLAKTSRVFEQTTMSLHFDELFRKKLQKVPHFVKKHEKPSIWPKLATFRANYHVLAFSWTFQQEVAKSSSFRGKVVLSFIVFKQPRKKLIYLPKNRNMLRDLDLLRDFRVKITQPERHPMLRAWAKVK